jgi:hypothetical protein
MKGIAAVVLLCLAGCVSAPVHETPEQIMAKITPLTAADERAAYVAMAGSCMLASVAPTASPADAPAQSLQCQHDRAAYESIAKRRSMAAQTAKEIIAADNQPVPQSINCISNRVGGTVYTRCD